jgi:hypothetical protein
MRKHAKRLKETGDKKQPAIPRAQQKDSARSDNTPNQFLTLQQTLGNRAVERLISPSHQRSTEPAKPRAVEKSVNGSDEGRIGEIVENAPQGSSSGGAGNGGVAEKAPKKKKAGVDSFSVKWSENSMTTATQPRLRLDYKAKFKDDDEHDPALAEFRQNAMTKWEIKDGPHKGKKGDTSPMHDDNYSRADDTKGHSKTDVNFESNDNPGFATPIDKDDDVDYTFTAEQMIVDMSQGEKVLEKVGPKTGRITGKHPRKFDIPSNC